VFFYLLVLVQWPFRTVRFSTPADESTLYLICSPSVPSSDPIFTCLAFRVTIDDVWLLLVSHHIIFRVYKDTLLLVRWTILIGRIVSGRGSITRLRDLLIALVISLRRFYGESLGSRRGIIFSRRSTFVPALVSLNLHRQLLKFVSRKFVCLVLLMHFLLLYLLFVHLSL
jgi:hypothetical protein